MTSLFADVSIAVVTSSQASSLRDTLLSLLPQAESAAFRVEFVIFDNGSTDETPAVLRDFKRRARVPVSIVRSERVPHAEACNLAIAHSSGTWLACCGDGEIATPYWLKNLYETAQRSSADFVGGSVHLQLPAGWSLGEYGPRARQLLGESGIQGKEGRFKAPGSPCSRNVLMRAAAVRSLGCFDTALALPMQDADLFQRARTAGFSLWLAPRARTLRKLAGDRLTQNGLRTTSTEGGASAIHRLRLRREHSAAVRHAARSAALLVVRDLPQFALSSIRRRRAARLDAACGIWYTRGVLQAMWPRIRRTPYCATASLHMLGMGGSGSQSAT